MTPAVLLAAILLAQVVRAGPTQEVWRVWKSSAGTSMEARLIKDGGAAVLLEKRAGGRIQVPLTSLSAADRTYIEGLRHAKKEEEAQAGAPDFRGLRLRMTREQVAALVKNTPWEYDQLGRGDPTGDRVQLQPQFLPGEEFANLDGQPGQNKAVWVNAYVLYDSGVVYKIVVSGPRYEMTESATLAGQWIAPAAEVLRKQYGEPAARDVRMNRDQIEAQMVAGLRRLNHWQYAEWKTGEEQTVLLCASRDRGDGKCMGQIHLVDNAIEKARRVRTAR
jgi:hypothetical protein